MNVTFSSATRPQIAPSTNRQAKAVPSAVKFGGVDMTPRQLFWEIAKSGLQDAGKAVLRFVTLGKYPKKPEKSA